jgi:hypothetical protein
MKFRGTRGQILPLFAIALPVLLGFLALTLDGGKLFVIKRHLQNAADAAALASAQDLGDYLSGTATEAATRLVVKADVNDYASHNLCGSGSANRWLRTDPDKRIFGCVVGGAVMDECTLDWDAYPNTQLGRQQRSEDTNCYKWPYIKNGVSHWDQVEVRTTRPVNLEFARIVGFHNPSFPMKRSVATFKPELLVTTTSTPDETVTYTDPDSTVTNTTVIDGTTSTIVTTIPGGTHTTTTPETTVTNVETTSHFSGGVGSIAFVKSTDCPSAPATPTVAEGAAFQWSGSTSSLSQFISNGGVSIDGNPVHRYQHIWIGKKNVANCERYGSGATGGIITGPFAPMDWPVQPPLPAPPAGCTSTGTATLTPTWPASHPPGIYCWTSGLLTLAAKDTNFIHYSFYAPQIAVNSNGMHLTAAIPASGQPPVLFYAYGNDFTDPTTGLDNCGPGPAPREPRSCAFSFSGNGDIIEGDIFVPNGTIAFSGAAANGSTGFMEAWKMTVSGNLASYQGTGPGEGGTITTTTQTTTTVIPASTQTTTDPDTTVTTTTVIDGTTSTVVTTIPGATHTFTNFGTTGTSTSTTSTDIGLGE